MRNNERVLQIVYQTLDEINFQRAGDRQLKKTPETRLSRN